MMQFCSFEVIKHVDELSIIGIALHSLRYKLHSANLIKAM